MPSAKFVHQLEGIVGPTHVLTDPAVMEGYVTDWTGRWRGEASAVIRPGSTDEVAEVVRACGAAGVPVVPQGGDTGLVGGSVPAGGEVVLSLRRLDTVGPVDSVERTMTAGSGATLAAAQAEAARAGFLLGIDLAARDSATVGGAVATNAGGLRVVRHGSTRAQVAGLEAVLGDGSVIRRWSGLVKDNTGYDLVGLLTGSEGTLGVITRVLLRLAPPARSVQVAVIGVASVDAAHQVLAAARTDGLTIEAAEYFHAGGLDLVRRHSGLRSLFPAEHETYLLLEVSGTTADRLASLLADLNGLVADAVVEAGPAPRLWAYREGFTEAIRTESAASGVAAVKLDVSLPTGRHGAFEAALHALLAGRHPEGRVVSFGHLAEGNPHLSLLNVPPSDATETMGAALELVVAHGGSISAEHGIGRAKLQWLPWQRSAADIAAMRAIKHALDPAGVLAPGVLLPD